MLGGDGTLNEAANGLAGTVVRAGRPPRRVDQRLRPHDRAAERPDRGHRRPARRARPRGASTASGLGSVNGRYFLFHVGMGFDAAVVAQVERRSGLKRYAGHPLFVFAAFDTVDPPLRPQPAPLLGAVPRRLGGRRRLPLDLPQHQPVHVPGQPAARPRARGHPRPRPRRRSRCAPSRSRARCGSSARRSRGGRHLRSSRWTDYRTDLTGITVTGYGPFPYQVDGDHLGDTEHLEITHEPEVLDLVMPVARRRRLAAAGARRGRCRGRWSRRRRRRGRPATGCGRGRRRSRC